MKKNLLILILSIISVVCFAIGLAACDNAISDKNNNSEQTSSQSDNNSTDNNSSNDGSISNNDSLSGDSSEGEAETETYSVGLEYTLSADGTYYAVSGIGTCTDIQIIIPSVYKNLPVKSIGNAAFYRAIKITSVAIPDSITTIGQYAFNNCGLLTQVTIPDSVTTIYDYAFSYCTSLQSITIPDSVKYIGSFVFNGCKSLTEITLPFVGSGAEDDSASAETLFGFIFGSTSFTGGTAVTQYYSDNDSTVYYIPETLTDIHITGGKLLYGAFYNCTSLISVVIGDSVETIGSYAFYNCTSLENITIPDNITSIGSYAFYNCTALDKVCLSDIEAWCNVSFADKYANPLFCVGSLYLNNKLVTELEIPESITAIGSYAFYNCISLESITFGKNVKTLGDYAFYNCSSLKRVNSDTDGVFIILDSVTLIGSGAFGGCSNVVNITLPFVGSSASATKASSSTLFGYIFGTTSYASGTSTKQYYSNSSYTTYYIPVTLTTVTITGGNILYGAFYNCTKLTSITIPDSVTSIGDYAFLYCTSLTSIMVDNGNIYYKSIGGNLYSYDGTELIQYAIGKTDTFFEIPDSVTSIGDDAFAYCYSLTSITITDSVTSIGSEAFYYLTSLKSVTIGSGVTSIGNYAFNNCTSLENVTIGSSVTSIGNYAFSYCTSLISIIIPDSVTSLGRYAFYNCKSLTSVTFENTSGWYRTTMISATSGTSISSTTVANASSLAKLLINTYCDYYWYRSDD